MELKEGMYVRTKYDGILKIRDIKEIDVLNEYYEMGKKYCYKEKKILIYYRDDDRTITMNEVIKASYNIIDLIEYMDLLVIENKLKDIDNREIYLFNPVRCDGFTEFEGGKRCMIINMDYIIPIENIKVYQVLTHEIFECNSYKVGD